MKPVIAQVGVFALIVLARVAMAASTPPASLDSLLETIRAKHPVPALAAAVVRGGETVALGAVGFRREGSPERVTVNDIWHWGSCSKSLTAVVAAQLVEEGQLRWDTTLAQMFPALAPQMQTAWRGVTLEQLLTHHGGVPQDLNQDRLWGRIVERCGELPRAQREYLTRELLTKQQPEAPPGTKYIYSNAGYALVGHAIEVKLDRPWEEVLRERLAKPLGLSSLGFGPPATLDKVDQPWGHRLGQDGRWRPIPPGPRADNPAAIAPAGTLHGSVGDLAKYAAWQVRGGRGQGSLLQPATFKKLHTPYSGNGDYAGGWLVTTRAWGGGEVLTHAGSNTMFFTVIWLAPKKDFAVVVCTNAGGDGGEKATDAAAWELIQQFIGSPQGAKNDSPGQRPG